MATANLRLAMASLRLSSLAGPLPSLARQLLTPHNIRFLLVQRGDQRAVLPGAFRRPDHPQPPSS